MRKYEVHTKHGVFVVECEEIDSEMNCLYNPDHVLYLHRDEMIVGAFKDWICIIDITEKASLTQ